ncbi:hypothetical protein [Gordonia hydrophobica]|uniref:Phasin family protein n=1 Tax=Gordonia hydrophobica TaxID=40516 RepID=A0ABZ2U697_9ACTN|nr:hypothetical protein [Gordonia hydrophobica]MBM7365572.1 hypothetical protein [Gordonia hydrophobica]
MTAQNAASKVAKAIDDSTKQINDVQATLLSASKQAALATLDVYEKSVDTALDFQKKIVESTGLTAASGIVDAQVKLFTDLNTAGVQAVRAAFA